MIRRDVFNTIHKPRIKLLNSGHQMKEMLNKLVGIRKNQINTHLFLRFEGDFLQRILSKQWIRLSQRSDHFVRASFVRLYLTLELRPITFILSDILRSMYDVIYSLPTRFSRIRINAEYVLRVLKRKSYSWCYPRLPKTFD